MKTLTIDAIVGAGFHSVVIAQECERIGLATFDKYRNTWSWKREQLEKLELDPLQELYTAMRESREEIEAAEPIDQPLIQLQ